MKAKITFKVLLLTICLSLQFNVAAQNNTYTVHVETPGTLSSMLEEMTAPATDLVITGLINGTDICAIRDRIGVTSQSTDVRSLDLSGAVIIPGGDPYVSNGMYGTIYTKTNTISADMFYSAKIESFILPHSVTDIETSAFKDCPNLTSITIGNGTKNIGDFAFTSCPKLKKVVLGKSVAWMSEYVFYNSNGLEEFVVVEGNRTYSSIDGVLFNAKQDVLLKYPSCKADESYVCPKSVNLIAASAFAGCANLTSISIPEHITTIKDGTFSGCTGLTSITIPNSVTTIGGSAFGRCTGLTSISIPEHIATINNATFYGCTGLTSITISNSVTTIGNSAFGGCTGLTSITIPNSVTTIGSSAFANCTGLTSITIPNGVTTIGSSVFSDCTGLTSITIPNSVKSIGSSAFAGCTGLTSFSFPENIQSIEEDTFNGCTSLTELDLGESVKYIRSKSFYKCSGLEKLRIPNSVSYIGSNAFVGCSLKNIYSMAYTPPNIVSSTFESTIYRTCNLYVPEGVELVYSITNYWKEFKNVSESDFSSVDDIDADRSVVKSTADGVIIETSEQTEVAIYNLSGQVVYQSVVNGNEMLPLSKGVYIVSTNGTSSKVVVR